MVELVLTPASRIYVCDQPSKYETLKAKYEGESRALLCHSTMVLIVLHGRQPPCTCTGGRPPGIPDIGLHHVLGGGRVHRARRRRVRTLYVERLPFPRTPHLIPRPAQLPKWARSSQDRRPSRPQKNSHSKSTSHRTCTSCRVTRCTAPRSLHWASLW